MSKPAVIGLNAGLLTSDRTGVVILRLDDGETLLTPTQARWASLKLAQMADKAEALSTQLNASEADLKLFAAHAEGRA